jgi:hypothetical protein
MEFDNGSNGISARAEIFDTLSMSRDILTLQSCRKVPSSDATEI